MLSHLILWNFRIEPDQLLLVMGEFDLGTTDEPYPHHERHVQVIAMHPKFEARTFEYDLALLRLVKDFRNVFVVINLWIIVMLIQATLIGFPNHCLSNQTLFQFVFPATIMIS